MAESPKSQFHPTYPIQSKLIDKSTVSALAGEYRFEYADFHNAPLSQDIGKINISIIPSIGCYIFFSTREMNLVI